MVLQGDSGKDGGKTDFPTSRHYFGVLGSCILCELPCPGQSLSALRFEVPLAISKQPLGTVQWVEMGECHPDLIT